MSARVLVVDDVEANVKILEAKLQASYYTVLKAYSGAEALEIAARERPDLILLDVMMPNMDGFECCRRLKANPALAHVPVVMVTALDQTADRVRGLEAGADDFLTKPPNDQALFARVRSLVRLKMMIDELRMRDGTFRELGVEEDLLPDMSATLTGHVVIAENRPNRSQAMQDWLSARLSINCEIAETGAATLALAQSDPADVFIVSSRLPDRNGLRLCSELRSHPETRQSAVIILVEDGDFETVASGLDLGANDYIMRPIDENELVARVRTQLVRKHYADRLRETVHAGMRMAVTDSLTGLYNRRYADQHLARLLAQSRETGAPLSAMLLDLDRFKTVNDNYGHAAGDKVLVEFARRLQHVVRGVDLVARYGGEEFMIVMPETAAGEAVAAAERVLSKVADKPFLIDGEASVGLPVTVSIGVAESGASESSASLVERADAALYRSKRDGRDRVSMAPAPAAAHAEQVA